MFKKSVGGTGNKTAHVLIYVLTESTIDNYKETVQITTIICNLPACPVLGKGK